MDLSLIPKLAGLLIPILGILAPVAIVFLVLQHRAQMREKTLETAKHFADKGMPIPRELLEPPGPPGETANWRFRAISLIGAGVGLALLFWSLDLLFLSGIGGLLICVGVAQLIAWRLDRNDAKRDEAR
jgi:Domain of unknown function (DUF6249)